MGQTNIFVLGLDEENERVLNDVPNAVHYRFHRMLSVPEIQHGEIPVEELLEKAQRELDDFDGEIGAVVGYWDFPVTTMVPILCDRYGLPSADLRAVVTCEHKYWSRLEQQKVIEEYPAFDLVDLDDAKRPPDLKYPMWLKPVKSFSSELAYKVDDEAQFEDAVKKIKAGVDRVGKPFERILQRVDLPPEIAKIGGRACLAEEAMTGQQAATEGYVYNGEITVYGALDSINYAGTSSFLRHQYPSQLPESTVRRMTDVSERVIRQVGLNNSTFSVEFFCDEDSNDVGLLEINARHSQSHAELLEYVDGVPNHHCMVSLGLGRDPKLPKGEGPYAIAAKWYHRRFEDGVVRRIPTADEIERIERDIPGISVSIVPEVGTRLSDMSAQDSYSYELADVLVGADSEGEMSEKFDKVVDALRFEFDDEEGA